MRGAPLLALLSAAALGLPLAQLESQNGLLAQADDALTIRVTIGEMGSSSTSFEGLDPSSGTFGDEPDWPEGFFPEATFSDPYATTESGGLESLGGDGSFGQAPDVDDGMFTSDSEALEALGG